MQEEDVRLALLQNDNRAKFESLKHPQEVGKEESNRYNHRYGSKKYREENDLFLQPFVEEGSYPSWSEVKVTDRISFL